MENNKEQWTLFFEGNPIVTRDKKEILELFNTATKGSGFEMLKKGETPKYVKKNGDTHKYVKNKKKIQIVKLMGGRIVITKLKENDESKKLHITVNGRKIYYEIEGNGLPCIILNGLNPFYKRTFSTNIRNHLQLIFVDLGFCGYSEFRKVEDITIDSSINDLDSLVQRLSLKNFALFGHSANALLGLEYARRFSDKVSHLIIVGSGPKWWSFEDYIKKKQEYWDKYASVERKTIYDSNLETLSNIKFNTGEDFVKWYVAMGSKFWYDPQFDSSPLYENHKLNIEYINYFFNEVLKNYDATPFLSKISCYVFIAMGKYDFNNPPTLWEGEKEKFANYYYHLFKRSGHTPQYEEQARFDNIIIEFITEFPID